VSAPDLCKANRLSFWQSGVGREGKAGQSNSAPPSLSCPTPLLHQGRSPPLPWQWSLSACRFCCQEGILDYFSRDYTSTTRYASECDSGSAGDVGGSRFVPWGVSQARPGELNAAASQQGRRIAMQVVGKPPTCYADEKPQMRVQRLRCTGLRRTATTEPNLLS